MNLPNTLRTLADNLEAMAGGMPEPLNVMDLPDCDGPEGGPDASAFLPVLVAVDGRPTPARACQSFRHTTPIYPESAAPELWRRYLLGVGGAS